ncbi:hypothetical protein F4604DRAFT_1934869 [Suillus subluteus]|nr:hypothetical protein F4604DRAFT_1934869 [Suillus subluteus]
MTIAMGIATVIVTAVTRPTLSLEAISIGGISDMLSLLPLRVEHIARHIKTQHIESVCLSSDLQSLLLRSPQHLPANPVPGTHLTIGIQEERIEHHRPHYEAKYKGILYATNCQMPRIVSVPLRDGVPVPGHVSRLQVWHWVDTLGPEQFVTLSMFLRETFNGVAKPQATTAEYAYTLIREHGLLYRPPNALIRQIGGITDNANDVPGNVLVIKHKRGNKDFVIDCTDEDIEDATNIIKRTLGVSNFWS